MSEVTSQVESRPDIVTVTQDNFNEYVDKQLGIVHESPEEVAAKEFEEIEAKKAADTEAEKKAETDPTHELEEVHADKKGKINERFSKVTAARKAAEEKAATESSRATALERELTELKAGKPAPVAQEQQTQPVVEQSAMPDPAKYTDQATYNKDYQEWQRGEIVKEAQKVIQAERQQMQQQSVMQKWNNNVAEFVKEAPDFSDNVKAVSHLAPALERNGVLPLLANLPDGVRVMDYYARNPEQAAQLAAMHPIDAAVQIGMKAAEFKTSKKVEKTVEASNAPAPITPIKSSSGVSSNKVDSQGNFTGTYDEWKKMRLAGKIK